MSYSFKPVTYLVLAFACVCSLSACQRENPLTKIPAADVASWIFEHKTPQILTCAEKVWLQASPTTEDKSLCDKTATELASSLSASGFGDVRAEDVLLGTIWTEFNKRVRASHANHYSAEKTHKIFDGIKVKKPQQIPSQKVSP